MKISAALRALDLTVTTAEQNSLNSALSGFSPRPESVPAELQSRIKRAYRQKAIALHPDKHAAKSKAEQDTAAEQMKLVNQANDLLTGKDKPDAELSTGFGGAPSYNADPFGADFFNFFNGFGFGRGAGFGGGQQRRQSPPPPPPKTAYDRAEDILKNHDSIYGTNLASRAFVVNFLKTKQSFYATEWAQKIIDLHTANPQLVTTESVSMLGGLTDPFNLNHNVIDVLAHLAKNNKIIYTETKSFTTNVAQINRYNIKGLTEYVSLHSYGSKDLVSVDVITRLFAPKFNFHYKGYNSQLASTFVSFNKAGVPLNNKNLDVIENLHLNYKDDLLTAIKNSYRKSTNQQFNDLISYLATNSKSVSITQLNFELNESLRSMPANMCYASLILMLVKEANNKKPDVNGIINAANVINARNPGLLRDNPEQTIKAVQANIRLQNIGKKIMLIAGITGVGLVVGLIIYLVGRLKNNQLLNANLPKQPPAGPGAGGADKGGFSAVPPRKPTQTFGWDNKSKTKTGPEPKFTSSYKPKF